MLEVKEAVQKATSFVRDVIQDKRVDNLLIDEVELSDDSKEWRVTISLPTPLSPGSVFGLPAGGMVEPRDYKIVRVDANTGEVGSIKIRKV